MFRVVLATLSGLENLECGKRSHFHILLISWKSFCVLVFVCSMQVSRTVQHAFECGVIQQKAPQIFLLYLKSVVPIKLKYCVVKLCHSTMWSWKNSLK